MAPPKKPKSKSGLFAGLLGKDTSDAQRKPAAAAVATTPQQAPQQQQQRQEVYVPQPAAAAAAAAQRPAPLQTGNGSPTGATSPLTPGRDAAAAAAAQGKQAPAAAAAAAAAAGGVRIGAEDARAAWQPKPRIPVRLTDNFINFMVMGDSGLGKTTFIQNLTDSYTVKAAAAADGSTTSLAAFQTSPDSLRTLLEPMDIPEAGRRLHVRIQDMPGWGDDINLVRYLKVVLSYILEQRAKDYELLAGSRAMNNVAMCGQLAHSITACVYFLPPHRVKKVDLILISAISQLVTVIPVVSKADTMTETELAEYRAEIRSMLSSPAKFAPSRTLPPLSFNGFEWTPEVMATLGLDPERMPLALVTSRDCDKVHSPVLLSDLGLDPAAGGVSQPVRKYRWGTAYSLHRDHSDLLLLKRLLMGDRVDSLYSMLDESYNRYTDFCAEFEASGKQLPMLVQSACSLSTPYLEYDDYTKAQAALDAAQQAMASLMAENKALMDRLSALERVAVRANGVHAPPSPPQL